MLDVGALFAGIGGIELGLERTGYFRTRWFVENNEFCQQVLKKHWPDVPCYGDITAIDFRTLPPVDVLTGGFPCQDISVAGRGAGIREGTRSGLWFHFARAIGILRPKYALIENVPMLARRGLDIVLANLAEAGYDAEWFDLRASDFGAPHRRERIFIVAYPHDRHWDDDACGDARRGGSLGEEARGENPECLVTDADNRRHVHGESEKFPSERREQTQRDVAQGVVVDPDCLRHGGGLQGKALPCGEGGLEAEGQTAPPPGCIAADDCLARIRGFWERKVQRGEGFSRFKDVRRVEDLAERPDIPEPLFRGSRDGLSVELDGFTFRWQDRIRALGNAVVPDCAEFIGELIMEFDKGSDDDQRETAND